MSSTDHTFEAAVEASLATLPLGVEQSALPEQAGAMTYREAHELALSKLAEEVAAAPAITDRKTREQVQRIRTRLVSIRTGLDKRRKDLFAPLRALKEQVDAYIGTGADGGLQGRVKALERVLEEKEAVWDQEQERIRQEAQAIIDRRNAARCKALLDLGFTFDGAAYWIGDYNYRPMARKSYADICSMNEEAWEVFMRSATTIAKEVAEQKEAERQAELARMEQEARYREEAERQAAEERAELEKLREEKRQRDAEAMRQRNERNAYRIDRLRSLAGDFADELESEAWANLADKDDATWEEVQRSVSDAAVRMAEAESIRKSEPEVLVQELPDPTPAQEKRSVDKGLLEMALAAALSLLDEATAARSAVQSAIAAQTLDRVIASAKDSVENLRGTINKDL